MSASATTTSSLPPLYAPWIEELLGDALPEERHATCTSCAMCRPTSAKAATGSLIEFDQATKCCTYVPALPNFLVGMVLADDDPMAAPGRVSVERRISEGAGVTPLGLLPRAEYVLIYKHAGEELFGRTPGLRCPHYLSAGGGLCGIWQHRNAVCATWYCKYERGRVGKRFWDALVVLLTTIERQLSLWAAVELGEEVHNLGASLLPYYATVLSPGADGWSERWQGRASEFYRASAELVSGMPWSRVREIGGPEVALYAGRLRTAFGALQTPDIPEYLRLGPVTRLDTTSTTCVVKGYSDRDLLPLSRSVADALFSFDGRRATAEVCAEIEADLGIRLDASTLRPLVEFGILLPMTQPPSTLPC